jgi:hypothetical protein
MRNPNTLKKKQTQSIESFTDSLFLDSKGELIESLRPLVKLIAETHGD